MSRSKFNQCVLCIAIATIAGLTVTQDAVAQQRIRSTAERRQHPGKGFWENQRASRSIQHARDYSRDLYRYSREAQVVSPEVAKAESVELGRNIERAQKELTTVGKQHANDKQVQTALESINKHIAKAAEVHKTLHEECCKDAPDGGVTMHCCSEITKELEKAAAEHAALLRTFQQRPKAASAKKK